MKRLPGKNVSTLTLEGVVRKRARRGALEKVLLGTLVTGGLLTVAMAAPKVLSLVKNEHLDMILPSDPRQRLHETASRLKRKGLVEFRYENGRKRMCITDKGKDFLEAELSRIKSIVKPKRWDRRWRIVIFDIPEKRKAQRDHIRYLVRHLGFLRLQHSVWVYPYDCEEVIALLKSNLCIGTNLLYLIADAVEYDRPLRKHFGLPLD
ncbi:hypothetical protein FJY93_00140 [Candidatus Kaiserbacteria bacterium]|nr:hypothetical protein [Candidatus Kaiserbacteria bacterium]